jgi:hypothetical protein
MVVLPGGVHHVMDDNHSRGGWAQARALQDGPLGRQPEIRDAIRQGSRDSTITSRSHARMFVRARGNRFAVSLVQRRLAARPASSDRYAMTCTQFRIGSSTRHFHHSDVARMNCALRSIDLAQSELGTLPHRALRRAAYRRMACTSQCLGALSHHIKHHAISNKPAAPMPPPTHIDTTT